jgi:hypothetical protein
MTRRVSDRRSPIRIAMMIWNCATFRGRALQIGRGLTGPLLRLLPFTAVRRFFGPIERMLAGIPSLPRCARADRPIAVYATSRPLCCLRFARSSDRLRRLAAHGRPRCARMGDTPPASIRFSGVRRFACPSLGSGSGTPA